MLKTIPPMPPVLCPPILTTGTLQHAFISLSAVVRDLTRFLLDDFPLRNILNEASVGEEDVAMSEGAVDTVQTSAAIEAVAEGAVISRPTTPSIVAEEDVVTDEAAAVSVQSPFSMAAIQARSVSPLTEADIQAQLQCEM
jgi:hypothetical protein